MHLALLLVAMHAHSLGCSQPGKFQFFNPLQWPGESVPYAKTPTVSLYNGNKLEHWGWPAEIHRDKLTQLHYIHRVKLHLQPHGADLPEGRKSLFNPNEVSPIPPGLTPTKIIADYLREMRLLIFEMMKAQGIPVSAKAIRWCLTVPAIWTDYAKDVMLQAARLAGWVHGPGCPSDEGSDHDLEIVPEPEAASLWSLQSLREKQQSSVNLNAAYLIVDLGGGTADLVMHGFRATGTNTRLVELTTGSGDLCGGSLLDDLFFKKVVKKFIPDWFEVSKTLPADTHRLRQQWLLAKKSFTGSSAVSLDVSTKLVKFVDKVRFPDVGDEQSVSIAAAEVKEIFDYVLNRIKALIDEQELSLRNLERDKAELPKAITMFLVGGMSESPYIQAEIQKEYKSRMTVYTPPSPGAAICRGAVVYGLNPAIFAARRARRTYGSEYIRRWLPGKDPDNLRFLDEKGMEMIKAISVFVYKNMLVEADQWFTKEFVPKNPSDRSLTIALYSLDGSKYYPTADGVQRIGELVIVVPEDLQDRTIIVEMNYSGPMIKVKGYPQGSQGTAANVTINLQQTQDA